MGNSQCKKDLSATQKVLNDYSKLLSECRAQLNAQVGDDCELLCESRLKKLQEKLDREIYDHSKCIQLKTQLEDALKKCSEEMGGACEDVEDELERTIRDLQKTLKDLNDCIDKNNQLSSANKTLNERIDKLESDKADLNIQLAQAIAGQGIDNICSANLDKCYSDLNLCKTTNKDCDKLLDEAKDEIDELNDEIDKLNNQVSAINLELIEANAEVSRWKTYSSCVSNKWTATCNELETCKSYTNQLVDSNTIMQLQLNSLNNSSVDFKISYINGRAVEFNVFEIALTYTSLREILQVTEKRHRLLNNLDILMCRMIVGIDATVIESDFEKFSNGIFNTEESIISFVDYVYVKIADTYRARFRISAAVDES